MSLQRLFPTPCEDIPLAHSYLSLHLHKQARAGDVLIYANYIASLDGRISLRDHHTGEFSVPQTIANKRDWRLYQELAAQADIMITSARYFRQFDKGCAQDLLPIGQDPEYQDLALWRKEQGMKAQPDILIVSASLDIPLKSLQLLQGRKIYVATIEHADAARKKVLQDMGVCVFTAGKAQVCGGAIKACLIEQGYGSAYMIAGPAVHATLLTAGVLNRLFLTTHLSLLGQDDFHTILQGDMDAIRLKLHALYLDKQGAQIFGQYDVKGVIS
jgi:riboflavin biosynthesis pyrimidine reductase